MLRQTSLIASAFVLVLLISGVEAQQDVAPCAVEPLCDPNCDSQCNECGSDCNGSPNCGVCSSNSGGCDCGGRCNGRCRSRADRRLRNNCDCGSGSCRQSGCTQGNGRQSGFGQSYFDQDRCDGSCYDDGGNPGFDPCCRRGPWYISGFGGLSSIDNFFRKLEIDEGDPDVTTFLKIGPTLQDGLATGLSIGRYVHPQGRTEFEFTYRDNGIGDFFRQRIVDNVVAFQTIEGADGNIKSYSGMLNILFDFQPRQVGCAQLYGGGGVGVLYFDGAFATDGVAAGPMIAEPIAFEVNDSGFAYQGIVGVNYAFRQRIDLYSEFRYLGSQSISIQDVTNNVAYGNFQVDTYSVFFGVRIFK